MLCCASTAIDLGKVDLGGENFILVTMDGYVITKKKLLLVLTCVVAVGKHDINLIIKKFNDESGYAPLQSFKGTVCLLTYTQTSKLYHPSR